MRVSHCSGNPSSGVMDFLLLSRPGTIQQKAPCVIGHPIPLKESSLVTQRPKKTHTVSTQPFFDLSFDSDG